MTPIPYLHMTLPVQVFCFLACALLRTRRSHLCSLLRTQMALKSVLHTCLPQTSLNGNDAGTAVCEGYVMEI
jgi:hypothetical protein